MRTIRIIHERETGYGWSFTSPDLPGLIGGSPDDADYEYAQRHAEDAVRFHVACEAEEHEEPVPQDITVVHVVADTGRLRAARAS